MCGFLLSLAKERSIKESETAIANFREACEKIACRGPDHQVYTSYKHEGYLIHSFHARLIVQGNEKNGAQPMHSKNKRITLFFNGEIYNHFSLREKLPDVEWAGSSDSETLAELMAEFGVENTINQLDGMYAIVAIDWVSEKVSCARDLFGEKPLYYYKDSDTIAFSSTVEALQLALSDLVDFEFDNSKLNQLLSKGYLANGSSPYKNMSPAPTDGIMTFGFQECGSSIFVEKETTKAKLISRSINKRRHVPTGDFDQKVDELEQVILSAMEGRLVSEVPIGIFLSGGVDSMLLAGAYRKLRPNDHVKAFSVRYPGLQNDEIKFAERAAEHLQLDHYIFDFDYEIFKHYFLKYSGEAFFADDSFFPTLFLAEHAAKHVKVCFSGDGADEFFCGYNRYPGFVNRWTSISRLPQTVLKLIDRINLLEHPVSGSCIGYNYYKCVSGDIAYDHMPKGLKMLLDSTEMNHWDRLAAVDIFCYLENDLLIKSDRASMQFGLEVRLPYLDPKVSEFGINLGPEYKSHVNGNKPLCRALLTKYLPASCIKGPKTGFGVPNAYFQEIKNDLPATMDCNVGNAKAESSVRRYLAESWFKSRRIKR